jgi:hypothetical protein
LTGASCRIDQATALIRKAFTKHWLSKIVIRVLVKMRHRDKASRKDILRYCNAPHFVACMPLISKQSAGNVNSTGCLLQSKELALRHDRLWCAFEAILKQMGVPAGSYTSDSHLDAAFDQLYAHFRAFHEVYRFVVVSPYAFMPCLSDIRAYHYR